VHTEVAVLADTHVPEQADAIPEPFRERIAAADHVIHGGDFGSHEAIERVRDLNDDLTAVFGNADPADAQLPRVASADLGGLTFVVVHGIVDLVERAVTSSEGVVTGDDEWLDAIAGVARARAGTNGVVGIGGHSHRTVDTTHDGVRVLNPGSATGVGPADRPTMLTAQALDGRLSVTVNET
jgi:putative phosphoesterase